MNKNVLDFLEKIYQSKKGSMKYYTFGYQKEYQKNPNYDFGYVPFMKELSYIEKENYISLDNPYGEVKYLYKDESFRKSRGLN